MNSARDWTRMVAAEVRTGKKREQRGVGGAFRGAEAAIVKRGQDGLAKEPGQGPRSDAHTVSIAG